VLALDVSGSMFNNPVAGVPGLHAATAAAAMAMVTARVESDYEILGFSNKLVPLNISPRQRLDDVLEIINKTPYGATDCALPMLWAMDGNSGDRKNIDAFVIYTDSETWTGKIHPAQALQKYRQFSGHPSRLVVVGTTATEFSIADPNDGGMLDVVGFDTAAPNLISDFIRG